MSLTKWFKLTLHLYEYHFLKFLLVVCKIFILLLLLSVICYKGDICCHFLYLFSVFYSFYVFKAECQTARV